MRRVSLFVLMLSCSLASRKFDDARILNAYTPQLPQETEVEIFEQNPSSKVTFEKSEADRPRERNVQVYPPPPGYPPGYPPGGLPGNTVYASITLDVGTGTKLTVKPGEAARITFEVMNLRDTPQPVTFIATDTLGLVRFVQPTRVVVAPRGTARSTVELFPTRPESAEGLVNTLTMLAQAADGSNVPRSALIRVTSDPEDDWWAPHCSFTVPAAQCREFSSTGSACGAAGWNAEVTVRDDLSGLLRVEGSPPGSLLPNRYVAGTRAPVTLLMAASCCQETMTVKVWDASGNSRTCEAYVYGLTGAEIAAIVLGCVLLVTLIIVIVLICLLCRRRRRMELPRRPS